MLRYILLKRRILPTTVPSSKFRNSMRMQEFLLVEAIYIYSHQAKVHRRFSVSQGGIESGMMRTGRNLSTKNTEILTQGST